MDRYDLVLGLPHTNHLGLGDHLLLMHAGHFQWTSIARAIGRPLSTLRTLGGDKVYATFYFVDEIFPRSALTDTFDLDDHLSFAVSLRAYKGITVEGTILFDRRARLAHWLDADERQPPAAMVGFHPYIRFGNIFITPEGGNNALKVAAPLDVDLREVPRLPNEENPYHITKRAAETGTLDVIDRDWVSLDVRPNFDVPYTIDIDRDTNGAGLVYFANYVAFMDAAERKAMLSNSQRDFRDGSAARRVVHRRRIAYYGNVSTDARIRTAVQLFAGSSGELLGVRYAIRREQDNQLICLSEAVKVLASEAI
jgi:probable biosynthetic protein (TIGR04098 family)